MASAGDNSGGRSRPRPGSRVIRIPLIRTRGGAVPGQRITISLPLQGQGDCITIHIAGTGLLA